MILKERSAGIQSNIQMCEYVSKGHQTFGTKLILT